jgi:hypothetical protein
MKPLFFRKPSLAFTSSALSLSFHFAGGQTLYTSGGSIGASAKTNIGDNILLPLTPLHLIGGFKLGIDLSQPDCC